VADDSSGVDEKVQHWLNEIDASKRREKDFRKTGRDVRAIYSGERKETTPFNILFSNTETMLPAMYSQVPRPVVTYRYSEDPLGKAAAVAAKKYLEFALDTNIDGLETFHEAIKSTTLDALLPGRGMSTVKFEKDYGGMVCAAQESWDRVHFGYARKWSKVPWIAYERHIDEEEAKRLFGADIASKIQFVKGDDVQEDDDGKPVAADRNVGDQKTACVYQIWDRAGGKKIRWISPQYKDGELKVDSDPLKLTGFFNTPRPLQFVEKTDDLVPVSLYTLYESQAQELNDITRRLKYLVKAAKARGIYDAALGSDIEKLFESEENELIPSETTAMSEKGMDKAVWFMPLDKIIATIQALYTAREQVKQVIYEIMGISDILRGATKASETLGAQQIKSTWGSLRLKPKQAEVQRYARDLMRMMVEIAADKLPEETWAKITGLPYFTEQQAAAAQQMIAQLQPAAMSGDQQAMQQLQQVQQQMQGVVKWSDVLESLKDDLQRAYRIDIETNSTVEPEAAEDQKAVTDLMTAVSQFVQGIGPLVQQGVMPFQVAQSMLLAISKRFRFGSEIEDQLRNMQPPKPEGDGGAKAQADADAKVQKLEIASKEREAALQSQLRQAQEQIQSMQREMQLTAKENKLALDTIDFNSQREKFQLEQKDAQREIEKRTTLASKDLESKKKDSAHEQRVAVEKQNAAKAVDVKTAEQAKQISSIVADLMKVVEEQAQKLAELERVAKAPRRKTAKRGPDGKIAEVIEEVVQ